MQLVKNIASQVGVVAACALLYVVRSSYYRWLSPIHGPWPKRSSPRALSTGERQEVLDVLHEERFVDKAPIEVYARLLDEGRYVCSPRTMHRILTDAKEVGERRNQLRHPSYAAPELLATKPNSLWSWDITKLKGPQKWSYFHLYVILDVFSRYVVGWMVADRESKTLAKKLILATYERQGVEPGQLGLHADRGSSMKSKALALLLADLGVTKTHSRPHVSNDNPYSESQFKTLKYRPDFPERFGSLQDARGFLGDFFQWYNEEHHHSGIAMLTPKDVHHGLAEERLRQRRITLSAAYQAHPERFVGGPSKPAQPPTEVWINPPKAKAVSECAEPPAPQEVTSASSSDDASLDRDAREHAQHASGGLGHSPSGAPEGRQMEAKAALGDAGAREGDQVPAPPASSETASIEGERRAVQLGISGDEPAGARAKRSGDDLAAADERAPGCAPAGPQGKLRLSARTQAAETQEVLH